MSFSTQLISEIRRWVYWLLARVERLLGRRGPLIVIFAYHGIARDTWRFSIDREVFVKQMDYLLSARKPVTLSEVRKHISGEHRITEPSFVICFDDGYRDILSVRDFLEERNVRPALFALADPERADLKELGTNREFLTATEIQTLSESGWEVGCHSATHGDFWAMMPEQLLEETAVAKKKLEAELGIPIRYFAYPRGRYMDETKRIVREAGYELALSMDDGFLSTKTDPFAVPRIGVDRTHSAEEFPTLCTDTAILFRKFSKRIIGKFL